MEALLALADVRPVPTGYGEFLLTSLLVLVLVCGLAWVVIRVGVRRWVGGDAGGAIIRVRARTALEPRRCLYVVEVAGKTLLLGTSDRGIHTLAELDSSALPAPEEAPARRPFADVLRAVMASRKAGAAEGDGVEAAASESRGGRS